MIITCPYCQTRYQVAAEAIGSAGRKVQCAHCQKAWQASPPPPPRPRPVPVPGDRLFEAEDETGLDAAFTAEEQLAAEEARQSRGEPESRRRLRDKPADPEQVRKQRAYSRRRDDLISALPYTKVRRTARLVGIVGLAALLAGGVYFRTEIVRQVPDLAGLYETIGLGVNVVGLEFGGVKTLRAYKDGADVMIIDASIRSIASRPVEVPQVVVTLLDASGHALYEWSVNTGVNELAPGEIVGFDTQLSNPPSGAERVRLTFVNARAQNENAASPVPSAGSHGAAGNGHVAPAEAAHPAPAAEAHAAPDEEAHAAPAGDVHGADAGHGAAAGDAHAAEAHGAAEGSSHPPEVEAH